MRSRVAVIIRTKDRGRLLGRALDSVLAQTFSDWQIVLVNDGGSPAQVDEALEPRLARLQDRLVRLDNETSVGMEAASNLGIRAVDSEFIAVHDDDDEWDPEFLAVRRDHQRHLVQQRYAGFEVAVGRRDADAGGVRPGVECHFRPTLTGGLMST